MCKAYPGSRCQADTFVEYDKARTALAQSADLSGLERARVRTAYDLASADYAATFPRTNPGLAAAAKRVRAEQVALMPTKPAINEPGRAEYDALAKARHRLASTATACWQAELNGSATYETSQALYEEAVFNVTQAETAFRTVAWTHYDTTDAAQSELVDAVASGDEARIFDAKAVFYLTQHHQWPDEAQARYRAANTGTDERELDAAYAERVAATRALSQIGGLVARAYPHALLTREHPGEVMPPAPWVGGGRALDPSDTPQVRYLCEGGAQSTRWDRDGNVVLVTRPNPAAIHRLWAYGYHTEPSGDPMVVRVSQGPVLSEAQTAPAIRKAV